MIFLPGSGPKHRRRRGVQSVLILYSALLLYWMFLGFGREVHLGGPWQYNLVPWKTVSLYLDMGNRLSIWNRAVNLLGNVAVFVPFGLLLPLIWNKLSSAARLALVMIPVILLLECLQMLLHVGSFDVDDLLLNMLGVWAGYAVIRLGRTGRNS
ncbi:VanZ family protein [Paenibacillus sp. NPDC057934]|uniref:VanZ family protein n=1 Tax=Paenibacillus sp. NPDC057934 TaxID=3346282 RepID=UPI0036D7F20F